MIVSGNLTINGTSTTINSATLNVDDKTIEMGAVQNTTFAANVTNGSANITGVTPTSNLIPGMVVSISTAGLSVPVGTTIVSITNNAAVLSNPVTGSSGSATFNAIGPSDTSADGGGIVLRGTTNKSITWSDTTDAWTSTEHFDLATGKQYRLGNVLIASSSQIGPSTGAFSLGAGVTASSLTSVGTLSSLNVSGNVSSTGDFITTGANKVFKSESSSSGDYVRLYAGAGTAQWDVYGNGENLRIGDNSSSATARVQFDNPTFHRSTSTTNGVAALTAKQEVNNGGYLIFDGKNSSDTTVFSVSHNGRVLVSDGIDFSANGNAAGMTSELLDDYEEGTWTPALVGTTAVAYDNQAGKYTKIGRVVHVQCLLQTSSQTFSNTASGLQISGLPYAPNDNTGYLGIPGSVISQFVYWTASYNDQGINGEYLSCGTNGTNIQLQTTTSGNVRASLRNLAWGFGGAGTGGAIIELSLTYYTTT
jgi:hypothetical protein